MRHLPLEIRPARETCGFASATPARRARKGRAAGISLRAARLALAVLLFCGLAASGSLAEESAREQMQSLDEQVQEIKSDVLGIAAELSGLEERLLYPSNTQVSVFVSLEPDESFELDSIQLHIDGEPVARHIYSFKELTALQKGGVQRLYIGNVSTGEHQLEVTVAGRSGGSDVASTGRFGFEKQAEPKLVELRLAGGGARVELGRP